MLSAIKTAAYFEEISGHNYSAIVNCITHYLLVPSINLYLVCTIIIFVKKMQILHNNGTCCIMILTMENTKPVPYYSL